MSSGEDPGWAEAFRSVFPLGTLSPKTQLRADGLTALRVIVISMLAAVALFLVSVFQIADGPPRPGSWWIVVAGVGLVAHAGIGVIARRDLDPASEASLATSWRTRFFIGVAFAETPALAGFAGAIASDAPAIYVVGLAFSLAGFWRIAPTRRNLDRDEDELQRIGTRFDLTRALVAWGREKPS